MKTDSSRADYSFCKWYPMFKKNALEAIMLPIPEEVCKYLEHDAFLLPIEALSNRVSANSEWSDGSVVREEFDEESEKQPTFPDFSQQIQEVLDNFGAVFVKSNWSTPSDATWVSSTKTLKCNSLDDIYLLLKSSDKISQDLTCIKSISNTNNSIDPCLVLRRWRDIDPCTEFRCFVVNRELAGICQRDISQYYKYIETEKYDIQRDIKTLFMEKIKDKFISDNYVFDVIRYKKDKVKIVDFGPLNETIIKNSLFTTDELHNEIMDTAEFRFINEEMGIQPHRTNHHVCIPQEINEFFQATGGMSVINAIRKEVEDQNTVPDESINELEN